MHAAAVAVADHTGSLFPEEAARLGPMAARRRATFSSGRVAARAALAAAGCPEQAIGDREGAPEPPAGWLLSISHTDEVAVAVACRTDAFAGLGVDVEQVARMDPRFARYIVRASDRLPPGAGPRELTCAFALREAVFKALDRPSQKALTRIDLTWEGAGEVAAALVPPFDLDLDYRLTNVCGHVLAICLRPTVRR